MESDTVEPRRLSPLMVGATACLVVASLAFVVAAAPLYELGEVAARGLIDPSVYVTAVMGE
jgi:formate hydrogenlyase subunit 3/multisubunit Na+/H+ antiporter MnhD subunit